MLYNEEKNTDYINMNLKRLATEDEINTLNCFWKELLPYRYLNSFYKKLFKKDIFADKVYKRIKIKSHYITIKSSSITGEGNNKIYSGESLKSIATYGGEVNAVNSETSSLNSIRESLVLSSETKSSQASFICKKISSLWFKL